MIVIFKNLRNGLGLLDLLRTFLDSLDATRVTLADLELGFAFGSGTLLKIITLVVSNHDLSA
jgi:hypothetical protein